MCMIARKPAMSPIRARRSRPGMIFTIEPGLYFREDDLLIPPEYRGIGIRIEDDVLMTENGPEWISAGIPKQIDDVEAWMAEQAAQAK